MKRLLIIALLLIAVPAGAATATWTHDGISTTGYTIYFWRSDAPASVFNKSILGNVRTMQLDDGYFAPGIEYSFKINAFNAVDKSPDSVVTKWTRAGAPYSPPTDKVPSVLYLRPSGVDTIIMDLTP
jgi:hypothetical protein